MSKPWEERWRRYEAALNAASIPAKLHAPHRTWVESFLREIRPGKWWAAGLGDVEGFLAELVRKGRPAWQQEQASLALRLFFQEVEPAPWAANWPRISTPASPVSGPKASVPTRDEGPLPSHFGPVLAQMKKVLEKGAFAPRTRRTYLSWVRRFLSHRKTSAEIQPSHLGEYLEFLHRERPVSSITLAQAANALRLFYTAVLRKDPGTSPSFPMPPRGRPVVLSGEEIERMILALPEGANRLLARLLVSTGMTLNEAVLLRVRHVSFAGKTVKIEGKSGRSLPLPPEMEESLWIQLDRAQKTWERERSGGAALTDASNAWRDCWVFPSERARVEDGQIRRNPIHPQSFQQLLTRAAKRAGLNRKVTPHTLRHSFAVQSLKAGMDPVSLQRVLGLVDPSSTLRYSLLGAE